MVTWPSVILTQLHLLGHCSTHCPFFSWFLLLVYWLQEKKNNSILNSIKLFKDNEFNSDLKLTQGFSSYADHSTNAPSFSPSHSNSAYKVSSTLATILHLSIMPICVDIWSPWEPWTESSRWPRHDPVHHAQGSETDGPQRPAAEPHAATNGTWQDQVYVLGTQLHGKLKYPNQ